MMDVENVIERNINLGVTYLDLNEVELNIPCVKDEEANRLCDLFKKLKNESSASSRTEIFDEIIQIVRGKLKSLSTVGQILDHLSFSIKMLFVEKNDKYMTTSDLLLLNDIFQLMPSSWESDPVKVHLITKIIYETLNADFNNTMHVITKIVCVNNKLGFYVALTLFWALYLGYFKKDSHHYYKMYNVDKFFKLLLSNEPFNNNQDSNSIFQLLLLISIYQNYVLLNKENPENHQKVFQDFFKVSNHHCEKLKEWLINAKHHIEVNNPLGISNQTSDVLMLLEFLGLDLIRNTDGNQQTSEDLKETSHANPTNRDDDE